MYVGSLVTSGNGPRGGVEQVEVYKKIPYLYSIFPRGQLSDTTGHSVHVFFF